MHKYPLASSDLKNAKNQVPSQNLIPFHLAMDFKSIVHFTVEWRFLECELLLKLINREIQRGTLMGVKIGNSAPLILKLWVNYTTTS